MATQSEIRRLGRDLHLPDHGEDQIRVTPTGDLQDIAGVANLHRAQRNRALTVPGTLRHRPEYGGGLPLFVEEAGSPATRSRMANDLRRNALRDPRLADARVRVSEGLPGNVSSAPGVTVQLNARIRDDRDDEQITIVVEE